MGGRVSIRFTYYAFLERAVLFHHWDGKGVVYDAVEYLINRPAHQAPTPAW